MGATSEGLEVEAEGPAKEVTLPTADPASVEPVSTLDISAWLGISTERAKVSSKGFLLTVTNDSLRVEALVAVVFLSVVSLVESVSSKVVAGIAGSLALAIDKASAKAVVLEMCESASLEGDKADVSEVDKAVTSVGL
jgi:hypothetical protein